LNMQQRHSCEREVRWARVLRWRSNKIRTKHKNWIQNVSTPSVKGLEARVREQKNQVDPIKAKEDKTSSKSTRNLLPHIAKKKNKCISKTLCCMAQN